MSNVLDMTPLNDEQVEKLRAAAEYVETQKRDYDTARQHREEAVREAALTGASYREIARASGLSYQRVAQLLTGEKPPAIPFEAVVLARCEKCNAAPGESCDSRSSFHTERHDRINLLLAGKEDPAEGELGPFSTIYCRLGLVYDAFQRCEGGLSVDPNTVELGPGQFLGRWTGHKWERVIREAEEAAR